MGCPTQMGLDPSHQLTEGIIHETQLPEHVGNRWRDLARALGYNQSVIDAIEKDNGSCTKECCIAVLVSWMGREGRDATTGNLAEALINIKLKSLAEKLMFADTNQNGVFEKTISEMKKNNWKQLEEEGSKMRLKIKELEEKLCYATQKYQDAAQEASKMRFKINELEEKLCYATQKYKDAEQEGSEMRARIKQLEEQLRDSEQKCSKLSARIFELEEELASRSIQHQKALQKDQDNFGDATKAEFEEALGATRDDRDIHQETRERQISIRLRNLIKELKTYVTDLLQVPVVKEDQLRTAVRLDLLTRLSVSLQELYSEVLAMAAEACKCNENLKREFRDVAYYSLRAEHNDLVPRVKDLESSQAQMSDEEKKDFERLQQYQINRQRQVDRLDNLWKGLFSLPETLPGATFSVPSGGRGNSEKASRRNNTDPGAKQKQVKPPPANDDDKFEWRFKKFKQSPVKSIFRRKESKDDVCFTISYIQRDS